MVAEKSFTLSVKNRFNTCCDVAAVMQCTDVSSSQWCYDQQHFQNELATPIPWGLAIHAEKVYAEAEHSAGKTPMLRTLVPGSWSRWSHLCLSGM